MEWASSYQKTLKNQLTKNFEEKYLREIKDDYTGFNKNSTQEICDYLHANNDDLDETDLVA